jgi:predicted dehydrogenase
MGIERPARIGLIGAGWFANHAHAPAIAGHPDARLAAVCDARLVKARALATAYAPDARAYDGFEAMIDAGDLDGVVVASSPDTHASAAAYALARGLHVLVEKPMALTAAEAIKLLSLAGPSGRRLMVGNTYHFTPHALRAREIIREGRLGELQLVSVLFASMVRELYRGDPAAYNAVLPFAGHPPEPSTYSTPAGGGGGQGHSQVSHAAALIFWLTGTRATSVYATMSAAGLQVDLCDALSFNLEDGAIGTLASTGGIPPGQPSQHEHRYYGSDGFLLLDLNRGTLALHASSGNTEVLNAARQPGVADALYPVQAPAHNLIEVILRRAEPMTTGEVGLHTTAFLEASYASAASGQRVAVQELVADSASLANQHQ